jgi:NTP pyrophosphatase (non-canonical NTP hydrolase)
MSDELTTLWDSTAAFHERFDTMNDVYAFIPAQWRVFMEEVSEFGLEAIGDVEFCDDDTALEEELADVIVVGIGLLLASGRTLDQLQAAISAVAAKNDAKTAETHAKDAKGKVARKTT